MVSTVFIYVLLSIQQVMIPKKEEKEFIEGLRKRHMGISKTEDKFAIELRKRKVAYRRQVKMGIYRVDFYVPPSIVVEIEGLCHEESWQAAWDRKRLAYLERLGLRVYNLPASDVYKSPREYAGLIANEHKRLREEKTIVSKS